jgi:hypothetical protein
VWVSKLGEKKVHFGDEKQVTGTFKFDIGAGAADRFLYKGFDINVTAMDRNENLGYKEAEMPGIVNMVLNALLGALLAYVKFIMELASGIFNWIFDTIKNMFNCVVDALKDIVNIVSQLIESYINPYLGDYLEEDEQSKGKIIDNAIHIFDLVSKFADIFAMVGTAFTIVFLVMLALEMILKGVPISSVITIAGGVAAGIIISLISGALMNAAFKALDIEYENVFELMAEAIGEVIKIPKLILDGASIALTIILEFALGISIGRNQGNSIS